MPKLFSLFVYRPNEASGRRYQQIVKQISNYSKMSLLVHHRTGTLLVKMFRLKSVIPMSQKKVGKEKN